MVYIDKEIIYTNDAYLQKLFDLLEETTGKPWLLIEGEVVNVGTKTLSNEERLIQYSKILLGLIGLAILAWKL